MRSQEVKKRENETPSIQIYNKKERKSRKINKKSERFG